MYEEKEDCGIGGGKMKKETVVVLQNDENEARECAEKLSQAFDVLLATDNASLALDRVRKSRPAFLITSVTLRSADGISVIEAARKFSPQTRSVVISVMSGGELVRQVMEAGAAYYMIKPIDYSTLIKRMLSLVADCEVQENPSGGKGIDERISRIFIGMGMPPHIKGYSYLREGIKLAVEKPDIINTVTKGLYPAIGTKFNTSASKVERAIRHAIEVAWNKGKVDSFNALFGVHVYSESDKPTNSEFIALIADRLLLDGLAG